MISEITQILNLITQIFGSPLVSVVLSLFLLFQWYRQHAKEQSIKNNLFSIRRMIDRTLSFDHQEQVSSQKSADLIDVIDSTLATLGARPPFQQRVTEILHAIKVRFFKASFSEIERLPSEIDEKYQEEKHNGKLADTHSFKSVRKIK